MKKLALAIGSLALPLVSFAQLSDADSLLGQVKDWIDAIVPILFALALVFFLWGLVKFMFGGAEDKEKAKNIMIWGIVALFVMASVWGLVAFLTNTAGLDNTIPDLPTIPS